jgi:hypothetical protein
MNKIILDLRESGTPEEVHDLLECALDFPEYYGRNLDALHDCLTDVSEDTCVLVRGAGEEPDEEYDEDLSALDEERPIDGYLRKVRKVMQDAEEENPHICFFFV